MTDTEAKAHQLEMECAKDMGITSRAIRRDTFSTHEALCRAIEREAATEARHAAELRELKERFSEVAVRAKGFLKDITQVMMMTRAVVDEYDGLMADLTPFILPASDPLVEYLVDVEGYFPRVAKEFADRLRLATREGKIVWDTGE